MANKKEWSKIMINKNRGWRGLAEVKIINEDGVVNRKMIFSFSQPVWEDLIKYHTIVMQDNTYYYILKVEDEAYRLPRPHQQRSVLIKNYLDNITDIIEVNKSSWTDTDHFIREAIYNFIKNRNNHTTSDWNCIGVRVMPDI